MIAKSTKYAKNRDAAARARGLDDIRVWVPVALHEALKADAAAREQTMGECFEVLAQKWVEEL
jgi:hypothetical protein